MPDLQPTVIRPFPPSGDDECRDGDGDDDADDVDDAGDVHSFYEHRYDIGEGIKTQRFLLPRLMLMMTQRTMRSKRMMYSFITKKLRWW